MVLDLSGREIRMGANKDRGTRWETAIVNYLSGSLHTSIRVNRAVQSGYADVGDIHVGEDFTLQAKDWEKWSKADLWKFVDAAERQAIHAKRPWGVAVVKRRRDATTGSTGSVGDATVAMSLSTFSEILHDLQEGKEALESLERMEDRPIRWGEE
jgi:hypothetical protein